MTIDVGFSRAAAIAAMAAAGALAAAATAASQGALLQAPMGARRPEVVAALPSLPDAEGRPTSLAGDGAPPPAIVVAFTSSGCPVATAQAPKIAALAAAYGPRGARVLLVDADVRDGAEAVAAAWRAAGGAVPALVDREQQWAQAFGVERAAEVFVLDGERRVRYRGALDDELSTGMRKPAAQRRFVAEALDALLAGKPVVLAATRAQGCLLTRRARPSADSPAIVYHRDVAPILRKHCVECHRPGEIGPFPLLDYADAEGASAMIREVVEQRRMPPWHADPRYGSWSNARVLDDAERATLVGWVAGGAPEGARPAAATAPVASAPAWRIGTPDLVVRAPTTRVPASGTVDYRYVAVDAPIDADRWVVAAEVHPGARAVVHHVIVYVQYPQARKHEQPPSVGNINGALLAGFVPGARPTAWPAGTGKCLPKGAKLLFQIHYATNGMPHEDTTEIGVVFARGPAPRPVVTRFVVPRHLQIPPGDPAVELTAEWTVPHDLSLLSLMPHMHYRGKSFRYEAIEPGGESRVLLDVPRFDFAWQTTYRAASPLRLARGSRLRCTAVFDNSAANPANPDPSATVRWGDQSWEEMMIGYVDYVED